MISRLGTQHGMTATHKLKSKGQGSSTSLKQERCSSYTQAKEQETEIISKLETKQDTAATHMLESKAQVLSSGIRCIIA